MKQIRLFIFSVIILTTACQSPEKPLTQEEGAIFASTIGKSVAKRDNSIFKDAFDAEAIYAKMKAASPNESDEFWTGVKQGLRSRIDFGDNIIQALGKKGTYALVKQYQKDNKQHILFRLIGDNGGLNYHDFELSKKKDKVKIADVYMYTTGEHITETFKNMYTEILDVKNEDAMYKASRMGSIRNLLQKGEYQKAKQIIDALPANIRLLKMVQIYNIEVCSQISDSLNLDAIEKFQQYYPGDPSLDLMLIASYFFKQKHAEALDCVNRLDKQINTDPYLDYYRGLIYNVQGKKLEAQQSLERLYKNMPDFSQGAIDLSTYYLDKNEYEKAVDIVKKVKQNKDFNEALLENLCLLYPKLKPMIEK